MSAINHNKAQCDLACQFLDLRAQFGSKKVIHQKGAHLKHLRSMTFSKRPILKIAVSFVKNGNKFEMTPLYALYDYPLDA